MKRLLLLSALLCLAAGPVRADENDDDAGEAEVIKAGPRGGGPHGPMCEDGDCPMGGPMGGGMGRMMMPHGRMGKGTTGGPGFEPDPAMKERREKLRAAQEKVHELGRKLRKAKGAEKDALRKDAKAALGELFDARLAMEQAMVDKMTEHLAEKKAGLEKRKAAKEKLVQERLDKLAGDAPSWDD